MSNCTNLFYLSTISCQLSECLSTDELTLLAADLVVLSDMLANLAAAIGYSTKTVGRIERGDSTPSAEFMLRISKYFNMLVEDVFHVED